MEVRGRHPAIVFSGPRVYRPRDREDGRLIWVRRDVSLERPMMMAYSIGTGSQGLYYGWEAIVRYADHHAGVNLLLNRRSTSSRRSS